MNAESDGLAASTVLGLTDIHDTASNSTHEGDAEEEIGAWSMKRPF